MRYKSEGVALWKLTIPVDICGFWSQKMKIQDKGFYFGNNRTFVYIMHGLWSMKMKINDKGFCHGNKRIPVDMFCGFLIKSR